MADLFAADGPSLQDMLGCARRELAMREKVYPRWVETGKMKRDEAERELSNMRAIVAHFEHSVVVAGLARNQSGG